MTVNVYCSFSDSEKGKWGHIQIDVEGNIYPCCMYEQDMQATHSLHTDTIEDAIKYYESELLPAIKSNPPEICKRNCRVNFKNSEKNFFPWKEKGKFNG